MTSDSELIDRLDRGTAAAFEGMTRRTPGGRVFRRDGLLLVVGAVPSPVVVNTILPEAAQVTASAVEDAVGVFQEVGHVPSLMTRDHHDRALTGRLAAHRWRLLVSLPGMVLGARPPAEDPPGDVVIHPVTTERDRAAWVEGNLHGFAEADDERDAVRSAFGSVSSLADPPVVSVWAEFDGRGVASSMAYLDGDTGMAIVGWVGTDESYRRRGLGRAVTLATIHAAFDLGARTIGLQASPLGLPVYEKLGFRTITGYGVWLPPAR